MPGHASAHDVGSAALAQDAGAQALGTTSGGHAYSIGRRDAAGETSLAVARIEAAVETANTSETVICARADQVMHQGMASFEEALGRLQAFAAAGAGCLYAPGIADEAIIERVVHEAGGPVNALLGMNGGLTVSDMTALGVRRISLGSSLYQAMMGAFSEMVREATTTGSLKVATPVPDYGQIESLFRPSQRDS